LKSNMNANPKPQRKAKAKPVSQTQIMPAPSSGKRARRRRVRAAAPYTSYGVYPNIQAPGTASGSISRAKIGSALKNLYNTKLTEQGNAFLKCAFAPPDFANSDVGGVPDDFQGKSLVKRHKLITAITNSATTDYYYLLLPTPGYAYWVATVTAGAQIVPATVFTGVPYSDFTAVFGASGLTTAGIVNRFRYVSNHIEIIPTTNQMTWTGSIQTFKFPVKLIERPDPASSLNMFAVTGLQSCNSNIADQYSGPFNLGVYAAAYNTGATFAFSDIMENVLSVPFAPAPGLGDFGQLQPMGATGFTGMDNNFDSVLVKFSGAGSNAGNSYLLKTWACVEYQVLANAALYEYQRISPCDKLAIEIYRKVVNELPVGVAFIDNEGFWRRVLDIIRRVTSVGSALPGQYGMISMGVNTAAEALHQLTL
jgi:hypothetical protein